MAVTPFAASDETLVKKQVEHGVEVAADRHVARPTQIDTLGSPTRLSLRVIACATRC